jgi:hypothetical protein
MARGESARFLTSKTSNIYSYTKHTQLCVPIHENEQVLQMCANCPKSFSSKALVFFD